MLLKPVAIGDMKNTNLMQLLVLLDVSKTQEKSPILFTMEDIDNLMLGVTKMEKARKRIEANLRPATEQYAYFAEHIMDYNMSLRQTQTIMNYINAGIASGNITCKSDGIKAELKEMVSAELE